MTGACGRNEQKRTAYKFGLGESVGRGTLVRTRCTLKDNTKVDAGEIVSEAVRINGDQNVE